MSQSPELFKNVFFHAEKSKSAYLYDLQKLGEKESISEKALMM